MNQKTMIKGKIHYVGVNDRNKHLFEGLWPLHMECLITLT